MTTELLEGVFTDTACSTNYLDAQPVLFEQSGGMYQRRLLILDVGSSILHSTPGQFRGLP